MNKINLLLVISVLFINFQFSTAQFVELPVPGLPYKGSLLPYIDGAVTYPSEPNGFVYSGHENVDVPDCYTYTDKLYNYDAINDQWSIIASVPDLRWKPIVFILNGEHYYGMGENNGSLVIDLWKYNSISHTWINRAPFPGLATSQMIIFTRNNSAFFVSGDIGNNNPSHECWEYNSVSDSWIQKNDFIGPARIRGKAWTIDTMNYIGMGWDSTYNRLKDLWLYDAVNDSWILKDSFPSVIANVSINFTLGHAAYLHTGAEFWKYNPDSDLWSVQNNFPDTVIYGVSFCSDNKGHILTDKNLYQYDPSSGSWITIYSDTLDIFFFSKGIVVGNQAHLGNRIYDLQTGVWSVDTTGADWYFKCNGTGYATRLGNFESYDPSSHLWTPRTLPPLSFNSIDPLFDIGDTAYFIFLDTTNMIHMIEYGCTSDTWSIHGSAPYIGDVSFSISNKGYMGLGFDDSTSWSTTKFYEYDPSTSIWTLKAPFPGGPRYNAIGLSANSKGYVGLGNEEAIINPNDPAIYEYDPVTDTWTTFGNLTARIAQFSFASENAIYIGNGYRRVSMSCDGISFRDFYKSDSSFITSVLPNMENEKLLVYPNPINHGKELFISNLSIDAEVIRLIDLQGREVFNFNNPNGKNIFLPSGIKNGFYLLKVSDRDGRGITTRLIILD